MNNDYLNIIKNYVNEISKLKKKNSNEHTYRTPLENMIKYFCLNCYSNINIIQETTISDDTEKKVFPDFTIINDDEQIIGFIECKDVDFDLKKAISGKSTFKQYKEQLLKYLSINNNLLFTDYFIFIHLHLDDNNNIAIINEIDCINSNYEDFYNFIFNFFSFKAQEINKMDFFIFLIARRTKILRDFISLELLNNESYLKTDVKGLFENTLFTDLSDKDFADAFSQIITFSLLFYRLDKRENVSLESFRNMPDYIPIFREFLLKIDINDFNNNSIYYSIVSIINAINSYNENIFYGDLSYKDNHDKEDPFIYIYEHFLKEFDSKTRNAKGVFYTPIEIVEYIVKSIDEILKERLDILDGIYNKDVHILDFATGTGTFLLGAIEFAYNSAKNSGIGGVWEKIVSEFILKRLYGFEVLIVPYVLAHFRIHEYLKDLNYKYKAKERLQLYLTNTLDNSAGGSVAMYPNMKNEADSAFKIKNEKPLLVIMGNPPYNSKSEKMNSKEWILELLEYYKNNLTPSEKQKVNDDYIKFLRFAHWKMQDAEKGIVGVVVNNSFLNSRSFREMRNKLMQTFDEIYIFDLHGNNLKGEKCLDGSDDFNIFNIEKVGVCIALFIKTGLKNNKNKGVYFQEIFGTREYKKEYLSGKSLFIDIKNNKWKKLEDDPKLHWFREVNIDAKYIRDFKNLTDIFNNIISGVKTEKDTLIIHLSEDKLNNALDDINKLSIEELYNKYNLKRSDNKTKCLYKAKKEVEINSGIKLLIQYRTFDFRFIYYTCESNGCVGRPRYNIMKNFINKDNIGLVCTSEVVADIDFENIFVSNKIIDINFTKYQTYFSPLYIYDEIDSKKDLDFEEERKPNFTNEFNEFLKTYLDKKLIKKEEYPRIILSYIYAILYAPTYRSRYKENLKCDYPRIPFTEEEKLFFDMAKLGDELIDLHLMKKVPNAKSSYPISGSDDVMYCKFEDNKIKINDTQYFDNVLENVYNYSIGGYKPIEEYIESRETLTLNDITHIQKVISIIENTIKLQVEIDKVYNYIDK